MRFVRVAGIITCEFSAACGEWICDGVVRISVVSSDKSPLATLPKMTWHHKRDGHYCPFYEFHGVQSLSGWGEVIIEFHGIQSINTGLFG